MGKKNKQPVRDPLEGLGVEYDDSSDIEVLSTELVKYRVIYNDLCKRFDETSSQLELCQASKVELEKKLQECDQSKEAFIAEVKRLDRFYKERIADLNDQIAQERKAVAYVQIGYYFIALSFALLLQRIFINI